MKKTKNREVIDRTENVKDPEPDRIGMECPISIWDSREHWGSAESPSGEDGRRVSLAGVPRSKCRP